MWHLDMLIHIIIALHRVRKKSLQKKAWVVMKEYRAMDNLCYHIHLCFRSPVSTENTTVSGRWGEETKNDYKLERSLFLKQFGCIPRCHCSASRILAFWNRSFSISCPFHARICAAAQYDDWDELSTSGRNSAMGVLRVRNGLTEWFGEEGGSKILQSSKKGL